MGGALPPHLCPLHKPCPFLWYVPRVALWAAYLRALAWGNTRKYLMSMIMCMEDFHQPTDFETNVLANASRSTTSSWG